MDWDRDYGLGKGIGMGIGFFIVNTKKTNIHNYVYRCIFIGQWNAFFFSIWAFLNAKVDKVDLIAIKVLVFHNS